LGKKGRKYAANKKRREDPNPERSGKAINVSTKPSKVKEDYDPPDTSNVPQYKTWGDAAKAWSDARKSGGMVQNLVTSLPGVKQVAGAIDAGAAAIQGDYIGIGKAALGMIPGGRHVNTALQTKDVVKNLAAGDLKSAGMGALNVAAGQGNKQAADALKAAKTVSNIPKALELGKTALNQFNKDNTSEINENFLSWINEEYEHCPECGGSIVEFSTLNEKKDACYYKVKSRYKVWPSAYASGALVKCRKKGAKNWGSKSESVESLDEQTGPKGETVRPPPTPADAAFEKEIKVLPKTTAPVTAQSMAQTLSKIPDVAPMGASSQQIASGTVRQATAAEKEKFAKWLNNNEPSTSRGVSTPNKDDDEARRIADIAKLPPLSPEEIAKDRARMRLEPDEDTYAAMRKARSAKRYPDSIPSGASAAAAASAPARPAAPPAAATPAPARPAAKSAGSTFAQAFAAARKAAGGPGGVFSWTDPTTGVTKQYQTNIAGEKYQPVSKLRPVQIREANTKIYFNVSGTDKKTLIQEFKMCHDSKGWFLDSKSSLHKLDAMRAFGMPLTEEEMNQAAYSGTAATIGVDNPRSPIGSIPKNQRVNSKQRGKK
jgi:hypothetical protein